MAKWVPVPIGLIQGNRFASGTVLKAELGGTATVTNFASDKDGNGTSAKVIFNSNNMPTISDVVVQPQIGGRFRLRLQHEKPVLRSVEFHCHYKPFF